MTKVRWLKVNWPNGLDSVSNALLKSQYSEENKRGFLLSHSSKKKVEGRYIEKHIHKNINIDPFGRENETLLPFHYYVDFTTTNTSRLLEVRSPPTSIRPFLSELHQQFGLGLMVADVVVDPMNWLHQVELTMPNVVVKKIDAFGLLISKGSAGRISVRGDNDIRPDFLKFLAGRIVKVDSLIFSGTTEGKQITGELRKNGTLKIDGDNETQFVEIIRDCLESAIEKDNAAYA